MNKPNMYYWAADSGGCGHYRMKLPAEALARQGLATTKADKTLYVDEPYDVIIAQRSSGSRPSEVFKMVSESATLAVFEMDDDLFNIPEDNPSHEYYSRPAVLRQLEDNLAVANLVTVSTEYLGKRMSEYTDAPVVVLPNCVDTVRLSKRPESEGVVSVGWAGSGTHKADLEAAAVPLRRAVNKAGVKFKLVGADYSQILRVTDTEYLGWRDSVDEFYDLLDFDIGVAPLVDNEFNRSKSALKALEYGARGIPTIASDVEPYSKYIEHGVDGFLVQYDYEWSKYIRLLASDAELRAEMGDAARLKAETFDINLRAHEWLEAYNAHQPLL